MEPIEIEMRAGVTSRAEIQVEEITDALQVPIHAVWPEGERHFCFIHEDGTVLERDVVVGKNNAHYVEILDGLKEGEEVLLHDPRLAQEESLGGIESKSEESSVPTNGESSD